MPKLNICHTFHYCSSNVLHYIILVRAYLDAVFCIQSSVVRSEFCDP